MLRALHDLVYWMGSFLVFLVATVAAGFSFGQLHPVAGLIAGGVTMIVVGSLLSSWLEQTSADYRFQEQLHKSCDSRPQGPDFETVRRPFGGFSSTSINRTRLLRQQIEQEEHAKLARQLQGGGYVAMQNRERLQRQIQQTIRASQDAARRTQQRMHHAPHRPIARR